MKVRFVVMRTWYEPIKFFAPILLALLGYNLSFRFMLKLNDYRTLFTDNVQLINAFDDLLNCRYLLSIIAAIIFWNFGFTLIYIFDYLLNKFSK